MWVEILGEEEESSEESGEISSSEESEGSFTNVKISCDQPLEIM